MLINESGLVRCIKRAYKSAGYAVAAEGDCMTIYTEQWYIQCKRAAIPRKVLATIVEHMGMIPDTEPVSIVKDGEPQLIMPDVAADEIAHWRTGERTDAVTMATVIMQGYQIFQPDGGGACYGVSLLDLVVMEREMVEHGAAAVRLENLVALHDHRGHGHRVGALPGPPVFNFIRRHLRHD